MAVIDTNLLIRFLTNDQLDLASRAGTALATPSDDSRVLRLTEAVLVETVQVLSSKQLYNMPRETIRAYLVGIFNLPALQVDEKDVYLRTLDLYVQYPPLSFVDCMLVAYAELEAVPTVVTFDREFRRVTSITWEEP